MQRHEIENLNAVFRMLDVLKRDAVLPHKWYGGPSYQEDSFRSVSYYQDDGMNLDNGILGATYYYSKSKMYLSPIVVREFTEWPDDCCNSIGVIIHELTHLHQMRWFHGLLWPIIAIPGLRQLTVEPWAYENQDAAKEFIKGYQISLRK